MKFVKYTLDCIVVGTLVAVVVHGMVELATWLTIGVWLNEGGKYWYAFIASVAMFSSLYAFFESVNAKVSDKKWYQYQFVVYLLLTLFVIFPAIVWGVYQFNYSGSLKLTVIQERQPLFVMESDGSIQNKYVLKLVNKTDQDIRVSFSVASEMLGLRIKGAEAPLLLHHGKVSSYTIFIRVPAKYVFRETTAVEFKVQNIEVPTMQTQYKTVFNGP
ncbi:MAG: hypothetical protein HOO95_05680 [Gallionella sp.]|nr:hypothetical protein [Gallionella sp.]